MPTAPPVVVVENPEVKTTGFCAPLVPWPTVKEMDPPAPPVAAPDPIDTDPLVPELDVPELNTSRPLTPVVPALALRIRKLPLVVVLPALLLISM